MIDIPETLRLDFTLGGMIKVEPYYFKPYINDTCKAYSKKEIDKYRSLIVAKNGLYYPKTDTWLYLALEKYNINGKEVIVIGSETPWYETVGLVYSNRQCCCLEYNKRVCDSNDIMYYQYDKFDTLKAKKFDVCISVSSIEHSGLGRYGDEIDPIGAIKAMKDTGDLLKKDGLLFLSVPIGEDRVMWNAHRVYGKIRLAMLTEGWEVLDSFGLTEDLLTSSHHFRKTVQPVFVLRRL